MTKDQDDAERLANIARAFERLKRTPPETPDEDRQPSLLRLSRSPQQARTWTGPKGACTAALTTVRNRPVATAAIAVLVVIVVAAFLVPRDGSPAATPKPVPTAGWPTDVSDELPRRTVTSDRPPTTDDDTPSRVGETADSRPSGRPGEGTGFPGVTETNRQTSSSSTASPSTIVPSSPAESASPTATTGTPAPSPTEAEEDCLLGLPILCPDE